MQAWRILCISIVLLLSIRLGFAQNQGTAVGILVYKERPSQADEFANAVLFKKMARFSVTSNFDIGAAAQLIVENNRVAAVSTFDDLFTRNLVDDTDRAMLAQKDTELAAIAARHPKSAPVLKPVQEMLKTQLSNLANGQVRFRGGWMSAASYEKLMKQETEMAEAREKQRQAEFDDRMLREKNLKSRPATLAGRFLLKEYSRFTGTLDKTPLQEGAALVLPEAITTGALPLPRHKTREAGLREGHGLGSPAVLFISESRVVRSFRVAVALRMDGDTVTNTTDLQAALEVLRGSLPELAETLPLCVVSARTRLQFERGRPGAKGEARIVRDFGGRACEICLTEPAIHDDGSMHAILAVTVP